MAFTTTLVDNGAALPILLPGTTQKKAFTSASGLSAALQSTTTVVQVCATQDCYIKFTVSGTAADTDIYLPAKLPMYYRVPAGATKIAVIRDSADGNLNIVEAA